MAANPQFPIDGGQSTIEYLERIRALRKRKAAWLGGLLGGTGFVLIIMGLGEVGMPFLLTGVGCAAASAIV